VIAPAVLLGVSVLTLGTSVGCEPATDQGSGLASNPSATADASTIASAPLGDASSGALAGDAAISAANPDSGPAPGDAGSGVVLPLGSDAGNALGDAAQAPDSSSAPDPRLIGLEGSGLTPFPTNGMPLDIKDGAWTYVEFPDAFCRSGSKAGVTLWRNHDSKKVMFFFEGGGACFDEVTCLANPDAIGDSSKLPSGGILDRTNTQNPIKDWNMVYLPYCTGDVFAGSNPNADIGGTPQKFVGYLNTKIFLQRLVPTFADATDVLVTGVSAGGFGAAMSASLIQRAFPWVKAKVIDDSGPPMPSSAMPTCLQNKWRETWGFDQSALVDCGADCPKKDDYTMDLGVFLAKTFSNRPSGLIEAQEDFVISGFFGAGLDIGGGPCSGIPLVTAIPAEDFKAGLMTFREATKKYPSFGTYYPTGTNHTWLQGDSFYSTTVDGVSMVSWVSDIVNDKGTKHVGN
jgi:hypothetical protein